MIKFFYLILITSLVILTGCSSTYRLSDYSSRKAFYKDINDSATGRSSNVSLLNDSSFIDVTGIKVLNDTLSFVNPNDTSYEYFIPIDQVKEISFFSRWTGVKYFALTFFIPGMYSGIMIHEGVNQSSKGDPTASLFVIPAASVIAGAITGWLIGHKYIYLFNN